MFKGLRGFPMGLEIKAFVKKLEAYNPASGDVKAIVKAAFDTGILELQKAGSALKGLVASVGNGSRVGLSRFVDKAPAVYPSKGEVIGNLLASLYSSSSSKAKTLAVELAVALFQDIAKEVNIHGKYPQKVD